MSDQWSTRSVVLHWVSAGIVVMLGVMGFVMTDLPADSSLRLLLSRSHTAFGFALMALTVARLVARWRGKSPEPLPLTPLHRQGIRVVDGLIYATMFGLGASGAMTGLRTAWPQYIRGEIAMAPDLHHVPSREVHETLVIVLLSLVALHVGGVIVHEVRRGGALRRMFPKARPSEIAPSNAEREAR